MPPCADPGMMCVPAPDPSMVGFSLCIYREGDRECPAAWPNRRVFHETFDDSPVCTHCECSDPVGGRCSGRVSVYQDGACSSSVFENIFMTSVDPARCIDMSAGIALGSKKMSDVTYEPGSCTPSGGEPLGEPVPLEPSTFCCRE